MDADSPFEYSEKSLFVGLPEGFAPFMGTEAATIDDKGRLLFAKKKRDGLGVEFVVRLGGAPCLEAYPKEVFEAIMLDAFKDSTSVSGRADFQRLFFANGEIGQNFDGQGRVVLPHRLRKAAGLDKDVYIMGCGDHVEIWDQETYDKWLEDPESVEQKRTKAIETAKAKMEGKWQG
jgi:MraZ protein